MCPSPDAEIVIVPFERQHAAAFRTLNEHWISEHFTMEEPDRLVLNDPEDQIIKPGGQILMALANGEPVGCCALIRVEDDVFELAKMTVAPGLRGRGLGRKILAQTISEARRLGAKELFLGSNTKLADALHLYESFGFKAVPADTLEPSPYARANIFMRLEL